MNKTPYEVRLDVLKMAQEMLDREHAIKEQAFLNKLQTLRDEKRPFQEVSQFIDDNAPKMYDPSEVVTRSSALYAFVNDSTKNTIKEK